MKMNYSQIHEFKDAFGKSYMYESNHCRKHIESYLTDQLPVNQLLSLISDHKDYIYIINREYKFIYANKSLLELWGKSASEACNKGFAELGYTPELQKLHTEQLNLAFKGNYIRGENDYISPIGKKGFYEYIFTPLWTNMTSGEVSMVGGVTRDITHRKNLEQDKEYLLYTIAHDLRGPIGVIQAAMQILERNPPQVNEMYELIHKNIKKMDHLIIELLDSAKITSGSPLKLNLEKCNFYYLIQTIVNELQAISGNRFWVELVPDSYDLYVGMWDPMSIKRMLYNLGENAVKYGDVNALIKITVQRNLQDILISINNKGNPIPPEKLSHLNDFFQGRVHLKSHLRTEKGWGIGLIIVRGVVDAYGGSVNVDSSKEIGTTFTIRLSQNLTPQNTIKSEKH